MLRRLFFILFACGFITASFAGDNSPDVKVYAYYFHGAFRCPACHKLEQYSKETIETNFKDAISSGKLEFKIVNVAGVIPGLIPGTHHLIVPNIRRRLEHKLCLRQNEQSRYKARPKLPLKKINF